MVSCVLAAVSVIGQGTSTRLTRTDFVQRLNCVEAGNSQQYVEWLLGKPDEVVALPESPYEPAMLKAWRWGSDGQGGLATLGSVTFKNGLVYFVKGQVSTLPDYACIDERTLRRTLKQMYAAYAREAFWAASNPLETVRIVNLLTPLGQKRAITALKDFLRLESSREDDMRWVLHVLFDLPKSGPMRLPAIGGYQVPVDRARFPRWPVVLYREIPYCYFKSATLEGRPEPIEIQIEWLQKHATFRKNPLVPPDDPFKAAEEVAKNRLWPGESDKSSQWIPVFHDQSYLLTCQTLSMVEDVYRPIDLQNELSRYSVRPIGEYHREFLKLGARWDKARQCYVRADGSTLTNH